jgi:hypothetical protein
MGGRRICHKWKEKNAENILVLKPKEKTLGGPRRRWEYILKLILRIQGMRAWIGLI